MSLDNQLDVFQSQQCSFICLNRIYTRYYVLVSVINKTYNLLVVRSEEDDPNAAIARRNQTTAVILCGVIGALFDLEQETAGILMSDVIMLLWFLFHSPLRR